MAPMTRIAVVKVSWICIAPLNSRCTITDCRCYSRLVVTQILFYITDPPLAHSTKRSLGNWALVASYWKWERSFPALTDGKMCHWTQLTEYDRTNGAHEWWINSRRHANVSLFITVRCSIWPSIIGNSNNDTTTDRPPSIFLADGLTRTD